MKYKAKVDTLLKKQPVQGENLPDSDKVSVRAGKVYTVDEILDTDGLHRQVELAFEAGSWWLFLPHWDADSESGEVKATFSLRQANARSLIYGFVTTPDTERSTVTVRASPSLERQRELP